MLYWLHLAMKKTKGNLPSDIPVVSLLQQKYSIIHGWNKIILCLSVPWLCTTKSPLLFRFADIHPEQPVHLPFLSPFTPISQITDAQLFEFWGIISYLLEIR